ncbi:MAG: FAD binding domain-containing protein [Thermoflexales bacterium]|nr:FAD binding domain-containing protein [Thermoflexales bacterium]
MLPNLRVYHRPESLDEAIQLIRPPAVVPLGGGTVLLPTRDPAVEEVVDLSRLGLTYIRAVEGGIRIGATTTLQHLLESPLLADRTGGQMGPALRLTASRNLRGQATVGGTIAAGGPENPLLVLLLALDARLTVYQPEPSYIPLEGFIEGRDDLLRQGALITELFIPSPSSPCRMGFAHVGRTPRDRPIVCVAAQVEVDGGICREVRLALGGVARHPLRARDAEEFLRGRPLTPENVQEAADRAALPLNPPGDFRGSPEYRRAMAGVLARRALELATRNTR